MEVTGVKKRNHFKAYLFMFFMVKESSGNTFWAHIVNSMHSEFFLLVGLVGASKYVFFGISLFFCLCRNP